VQLKFGGAPGRPKRSRQLLRRGCTCDGGAIAYTLGDQRSIRMPRCMPMSGTATTRPTKNVAKPMPMMATISNARSPAAGIGEKRPYARQRGDDGVGAAVEHHRHRYDADANTMPANSAPTAK